MVVKRPDLAGDDRWQASSGVRLSLLRILLPDLAGSAQLVKQLIRTFPHSANQVFTYQTEQLDAEIRHCCWNWVGGSTLYASQIAQLFVPPDSR